MNTTMDLFNASDFEKDHIHDFMNECEGLNQAPVGTDNVVFESKQHGVITVDINPRDEPISTLDTLNIYGNLREDVPNIRIMRVFSDAKNYRQSEEPMLLTWVEARQLCAALWQIVNVAEFG